MPEPEKKDQEPITRTNGEEVKDFKPKRAISRARRELSEQELSTPAARVFMIEQIESLERENAGLKDIENRYHKVDKEKAVLEEKLKTSIASDITFGVCLTIGALLLGSVFYFIEKQDQTCAIALGLVGFVLIICGIAAKLVKK